MKYIHVFHQRPASLFKIAPYEFVRGKRLKGVPSVPRYDEQK